ncbi:DUF421 domain-containing protein [Halanaerocella petrolearia]
MEYLEAIWKTLLIFGLLVILTRVIGRKLLSQLTFFEFVTGVTIGTITGAYVVNAIKGIAVLISPVILTICTVALSYLTLKSLRIRKIIEGEPVVIIQNGKLLEENMFKARYSLDDLEMQLRDKGIFNINEVEFAVLESHGQLSVLKKSSFLPVTPNDLNISTNYKGLATEIIKDGEVLEQNLKQNNLDFNWLYNKLNKQGVDDISQVVLASLNTDGSLYIDLRNNQPDYTQKVED